MTRVIAKDVLKLLKGDRSKRAAHIACLRANPFCTESETLEDGVARLAAWLKVSIALNHRPLNQVVVIVLACFLVDDSRNRVTCVADLNKVWLSIARESVSPCATGYVSEAYMATANIAALCTLYNFTPDKYGETLMSIDAKECTCETRHVLGELQGIELATQARRRVVRNLVESAVRNVLKGVREDARGNRMRLKKQRRKLVRSMQSVSLDDSPLEVAASPPSTALTTTTIEVTESIDSNGSAADECIVCFESLGSKRALLSCGHARCCGVCAHKIKECPMCRLPVNVLMEVFV